MTSIDSPSLRSVRWAGHSHVCRKSAGPALSEHVERFRRHGLNYYGFGHPWEKWDLDLIREWESDPEKQRLYHEEEVWRGVDPQDWTKSARFADWRKAYSNPDFLFEVDCETPKTRFGHLWWLGWQPEFAPWHDYDLRWSQWETTTERRAGGEPPGFAQRMPAVAIRAQVALGALPVYAHPTSWWLGEGQHVTNIASTIVPDILTGQAAGCLVVMGYDADHRSYQNLWFNLLNKGYYMTGVAEMDSCLDFAPIERALFQNITPVADFSTAGIRSGLVAGSNLMTTGPVLDISSGGKRMGEVCPEVVSEIAVACSALDPNDRYRLDLIHNGCEVTGWDVAGSATFEARYANTVPGWMVARLVNQSKPYDAALTNPVFFGAEPVRVTGHPLPDQLIAWWEKPGAIERAYYLARGEWRRDFPGCQPGEIPWTAFRWDDWKLFLEA